MYKLIINGYQWAFETQEEILPWILQQDAYGKHERPELDEMGQPTGNTLPAEYTYEIIDMTAEIQVQKESAEALQYLKDTDWKVLRHIRQKALQIQTSMSESEYLALEQSRHEAAMKV